MPLYKKVLVMFFSTVLGIFIGYGYAESTLTRIFDNKNKKLHDIREDQNKTDSHLVE